MVRASGVTRLVEWFDKNQGAYVLDVGAHKGAFTRLAMRNGAAACVAFEPQPELAASLEALAMPNVVVSSYALMDKPGDSKIHVPISKKDAGLACLGKPKRYKHWNDVSVRVSTIDLFLAGHGWNRPDIIKIDVEGAELFVLKGGEKTIRENGPALFVEYANMNTEQFGYKREEIWEYLEALGYECEEVAPWDLWAIQQRR